MTDTGQVPGEGLPENAGMVEQPGIPAPGAYTYLDPSGPPAEEEDLLLMPSAQGGWSDPQVVPPETPAVYATHEGYAVSEGYAITDSGTFPVPEAYAAAEAYAAPEQTPVQQQAPPIEQPAPTAEPVSHVQVQAPEEFQAPDQYQAPQGPAPEQGFQAGTGFQGEQMLPNLAEIPGQSEFAAQPPQPMVAVAGPESDVPVQPAAAAERGEEAVAGPAPDSTGLDSTGQEAVGQEAVGQEFVGQQSAGQAATGQESTGQESMGQESMGQGSIGRGQNLHRPGAHEAGGRHSGSVDLNGVRIPPPATAATPPRRPLHLGPPVPDPTGGVVRSLADRGPAGAPTQAVRVRARAQAQTHVQDRSQTTTVAGPEYLDVPGDEPSVPSASSASAFTETPPGAGAPWASEPAVPGGPAESVTAAESVVPEQAPALEMPEQAPAPEIPEAAEAAPVFAQDPAAVGEFVPAAPQPAPLDDLAPQAGAVPAAETTEAVPAAEAVVVEESPAQASEPEPVVPDPAATGFPQPEPMPVADVPVLAEPAVVEEAPAPAVDAPVAEEPSGPHALYPAPLPVEPEQTAPEAEFVPVPEISVPEPVLVSAQESVPVQESVPAPEAGTAPEAVVEPGAGTASGPQEGSAAASGYDDAEREAVLRVMRERRDIRNGFRSDPIPHEVLLRVLEAAHTAPSVGHSQPWDFVVIRSAETRRSMHELAQRQRDAYAKSLPKGRAKQFKELKIEAILDTPVNIVVTADPTRGGRHTLGRHTQPQMAPYSSALAVENLWLAARAEGLGVGWVSFFDEREMVRALGLPEHLEVVAYLCVGYVDEFPQEPELMQAGWSKRRPLSWVVHEETYGRRALPGEEPHDLLQETVAGIRPLDAKALGEAWERQKRMTKPAGALGMLEIISAQLSGLSRLCPPPIPEPAAVAIFAGDHGVHAQGVTPWPQEVTGQMVANFLSGGAVCNAFATQVGAEVCVVDVGVASELPASPGLLPRKVRAGTADFTTGPALSREEVLSAIEVGIETARDLVAAGNKALLTGEMGIANTTVSAALICVYTGRDPSEVTGRGTGINDETHARKVDVVRRGLELHQPDPADPVGVLAAVGGLEHAALVGFLLGGASLRTPVILDGVSAGAAALVARAIAPEALAACIAGHRSAEPGHVAALNKLGLRPLVDLDLRLGEGTGALLALPVVQSAARAMHEVATFDSAGVTEK
ncbi:nicotinate-nucleotide--dimethylbenzimidazole phosphoribosyltransferase [Streptomyces sp. AK02-01A]|uniref:nicotinate-nucleotide--dimethylbenzimidazole phosphoribosyltransferase n=1 Tax=Streptomyces sp. AK02-01A TaxID=3028648 RepID=UPI0029A7A094|nr:nicotinate-nucleotide--dimethylbenzimidazole phosphoribosyltransferase [Streptomyces sp. AK02-01A]MDX3852657.1 nicotinate-nucleotide--dimethylbenzimidazole phosphoribosyltransferase [Streptomyces sp. AK02-01A]